MLRKTKKLIIMLLCAALLASAAYPAAAESAPSEKEEVIYVKLEADGSVDGIYAVNIFGSGNITDYGDYSSVEMLNTDDKIFQNGDCITFKSSADRVYMKGKLKNEAMPWDISLKYFIDGKEYSPKEVAGKSGKLEIRFKVSESKECRGGFFDGYALQASFTLDTEKCVNISASDATLANVGGKKQISYILLPGEGIDTVITADVTDFEMEAASVNGVPLSMSLTIDDSALSDSVSELTAAAVKLDDGAQALSNGIAEIKSGLAVLNGKSDGLTGGSSEIQKALTEMQGQLNAVSASSESINELVYGSSQIKSALALLASSLNNLQSNVSFDAYKAAMNAGGLNVDNLQAKNTETVTSLESQINTLNAQIGYLEQIGGDAEQINALRAQSEQLAGIKALLEGNRAAINGMNGYLTGINGSITELCGGIGNINESYAALDSGINTLSDGITELLGKLNTLKSAVNLLAAEYGKLDSGINEYTDGTAQILSGIGTAYDGALKLSGSTAELRKQTDGMDGEIRGKINEIISGITGADFETVSFVSEKNTNVKSVQFVIKTQAIEKQEEPADVSASAQKLTFWQKLLRLFGLY